MQVLDARGNPVTSSTAAVTLVIGNNPGGGALAGVPSVAAVGGVASFSGLSLNRPGVGYTLLASSSGVTGATSAAFDIAAGAAAQLAFVANPVDTVAGAVLAPPVVVAIQDTSGNTLASATASIAVSILNNPGNSLLGGSGLVAAVNGIATFADLSLDKAGAGYTLLASAPGLGTATSAAFGVTAGAVSKLAFLVQPSEVEFATPISPAVRVVVEDALGNPVPGASAAVVVTLEDNPGFAVLSGATLALMVDGAATFADLSLNRSGSGYTLRASSPGMVDAVSDRFTVVLTAPKAYQAGCDCQSGAGAEFGLWGLLALAALARRRSRG